MGSDGLHQGRAASTSSSGPMTRATRCRSAFPTTTRRSRTARSSSSASRRWRSSSTSGEFGDTFGPGKHTLTTDNIPVLTKLKSWKYGFNSPFKADVYYVTTRLFTGNKWGTANPIMMRDDDFGIVRVRAFGTYDFKIVDPKLFLQGSRRLGPELPARRVRRHDALAHRQRLHRRAGVGARCRCSTWPRRYTRARRGAAAAHQSRRSTAKYGLEIAQLHRRERVGAAGSRSGDRQAVEHGGDRQSERLREVPDGARAWRQGGAGAAGTATELAVGFGDRAADDAAERHARSRRPCRVGGRRRGGGRRPPWRTCCRRPTSPRRSACRRPT